MTVIRKMTVTRMIGVTAVAVMLTVGVGGVMAAQTADSTTWEGFFEADASPPLGNWNAPGGPGTVVPDGGNNYLNFPPADALDGVTNFSMGAANAGTNGGASFEIRTRFNTGGDDRVFGHLMTTSLVTDTHKYWLTYYLSADKIKINNSNSFGNDNATVNLDATVFNTYRFTHDNTNWNLYINDDPTPAATLGYLPNSDDGNPYPGHFAYYVAYSGVDADLDYLRYTDGGAFAAPEPATMALFGVCGLMLRRLRRRNR